MDESGSHSQAIRFGVFELDRRSGELRKAGLKIRLPEQSFQILSMMLAHPGEVVTREEIQKKLWPDDIVIEFEHGINAAVKRVREALGDDADNPRFVETLPRRGYRFIAPVDGAAVTPAPQSRDLGPEGSPIERRQSDSAIRDKSNLRPRRWIAVAAIAAVILLGVLAFMLRRPLPPPRVSSYKKLTSDSLPKGDVLETDGARIYFSEITSKGQVLAAVSTAGGQPTTIPTPLKAPKLEGISPDGSELLVIDTDPTSLSGEPIYLVSTLDGAIRRLGNTLGESATWLADGRIVYTSMGSFYVVERDGSGARKLVTTNGVWPRSSPDGKLIRFSRDGIWESEGIWEVGSDGRGLRPLFPGSRAECCGNWTPDQKYFLFQSARNGVGGIWAVREKGDFFHTVSHDAVQLAAGMIDLIHPIASKDGKKIFALGTLGHPETLRYDSTLRKFVPYLSGVSADWMEFSRDGQWVAYIDSNGTLWQSKADGSDRLQLTFPPMEAAAPRWSPDGKRITFYTFAPGDFWQVYVVPAGGGLPERVAPEKHHQLDPTWSLDGNSIAFTHNIITVEDPNAPGIFILDLKTRHVSKVPGSEKFHSPRWSPDGRYICALSIDSKKQVLFDFNTKKWGELTEGNAGWQNWSRDSRYVYYDIWGKEPLIINRVRVSDRRIERVAKFEARNNSSGRRLDSYSGLGPDDSPLIPGAPLIQEIFALDWEAP
jgi:DNA-binding winged helix-turn-helix (wHTH) protein/Tol biopolymer transport system component